jgi:hypothetical protein
LAAGFFAASVRHGAIVGARMLAYLASLFASDEKPRRPSAEADRRTPHARGFGVDLGVLDPVPGLARRSAAEGKVRHPFFQGLREDM